MKMLKSHRLRDAVVLALVLGGAATSAHAQQNTDQSSKTDQETKTLDAMVVTGSRITTPGLTTSSPVYTIDRETIEATQPVTAEEFIRTAPGVTTPVGPGVNNGSGGGAVMSMRDLGSNRSLVLIDGRRMVPFTLGGSVDINIIPVALIESVDLLTGGASAVYGADAVGGVTNFVLRRDFSGVEVSASYGQSFRGDQARKRADITGGANFGGDRGNIVLSVGRTDTDPLFQGERDIGQVAVSSVTGLPQGSDTTVPSIFSGIPNAAALGIRGDGNYSQIDPATGRIVPYSYGKSYNFNPVNYYYTPMERDQATLLGRFAFNEHAEAYVQGFFTKSKVSLSLASSGLFLNTFDVPIGNPFIPAAARQQLCTAYGIAAANCVAGNPQLIKLTIGRRLTELGPRKNDYITDTKQYVFGLRGDITDSWRYDAYYSKGESVQDSIRIDWGSLSKTRQALKAVSPTACMDPSNGCVPLNVFGPEGSITPEMINFINLGSVSTTTVEQQVGSAFLSGDLGDTIKSPWADYPIGVAFGLERRKQTAKTRADAQSQINGEVMGTGAPFPDRQGSIDLKEAYAELIVPILSGKPFAETLSLETGYRKSDFSTSANTGFDYGTWKYGLTWAPISSLRFRGMFQHAVRAPSIGELFAPTVTGLANLATDPCGGAAINAAQANTAGTLSNLCRATGVPLSSIGSLAQPSAGQVNQLTGGNVLLTPEVANTRTIGLVYEPSFIRDFAVTLDYWRINMHDVISAPAVGDVLNGCYSTTFNPTLDPNAVACSLIGRNTLNGTFNGVESRGILRQSSNLGRLNTHGYDMGINYSLGLGDWGRLGLKFDGTWVRQWNYQANPASIVRDCLRYYSTNCGDVASGVGPYEFKGNLTANWYYKPFTTMLRARTTSSLIVEPRPANNATFLPAYSRIPSYTYLDLGLAYETPFIVRFNLTINNLLDKKAPFVGSGIGTTGANSGNTFPQYYDVLGRYWTFGITMKF